MDTFAQWREGKSTCPKCPIWTILLSKRTEQLIIVCGFVGNKRANFALTFFKDFTTLHTLHTTSSQIETFYLEFNNKLENNEKMQNGSELFY